MALISSSVPINKPFREMAPGVPVAADRQNAGFFGKDGPSFKNILDTINPLQQLPGIGTVYRAETGDTISPVAKIAGGALFGGPIGAIIGAVDAVVEMASGSSVADHVLGNASATAAVDTPPPPVSQEVAQLLANDTLAKQAALLAAEEKAKKEAEAQEAYLATLGRTPERILTKEEIAAVEAKDMSLVQESASSSNYIYQRQERVYGENQLQEGLYKTAADALKS